MGKQGDPSAVPHKESGFLARRWGKTRGTDMRRNTGKDSNVRSEKEEISLVSPKMVRGNTTGVTPAVACQVPCQTGMRRGTPKQQGEGIKSRKKKTDSAHTGDHTVYTQKRGSVGGDAVLDQGQPVSRASLAG